MKTCKFCHQEMTNNDTVCPHCGKDNAETPAEETVQTPQEPVSEETARNPQEPVSEAAAQEPKIEEMPVLEMPGQPEEKKKTSPGKMALGIGMVVLLAAVLVALIVHALGYGQPVLPGETTPHDIVEEGTAPAPTEATIPADGNPDDATCKGSYTVDDKEVLASGDLVVATAGTHELTNRELQVYYWTEVRGFLSQYGPYASMFGLNPAQSLDTQICGMTGTGTWQQFFLTSAIGTWQNYKAMASEAEATGHQLPQELQEYLDNVPADLEKAAKDNGFATTVELLQGSVGPGADVDTYLNFLRDYQRGYAYFSDTVGAFAVNDQEIQQYFTDHEQEMADQGITKDTYTVDVRHILIPVDPADAENEQAWKTAEEEANKVLNQWLEGEKTEESFAVLAGEHSQDPGSQANGGLYQGVGQGEMVPTFDAWCFEDGRQSGDYGIVKTDFGYHIMYWVGSNLVWQSQSEAALLDEMTRNFIAEVAGKYPLDVDYSAIRLGFVDLTA